MSTERTRQYLLDTNVISGLRLPERNPDLAEWASSIPWNDQFVAAPTMAEIERGIFAKERADAAQGKLLRHWFDHQVLPAFSGRVLPFDLAAARILAEYRVPEHSPLDDALIAAIAQANTLVVATRNTRHFDPLGVALVNPWEMTK